MDDSMDPCPFARPKDNGAHSLSFIIPDSSQHPLTLVCERCGSHKQIGLDPIPPLDDLNAESIRALSLRGPA